ncbi:MAG: pyrroline-5-carboxylate reductase [Armatimonadota bacterium]
MLENKRIGFIGGGMMAEAIVQGLIDSGISASQVTVFDTVEARRAYFAETYGITCAINNESVVKNSDIIILAVKPYVMPNVLSEICNDLRQDQLLISIAAGVTIKSIQGKLERNVPVIRVMPNTPCLIRKGISALAPGSYANDSHIQLAMDIFRSAGKAIEISEDKLDAVTGLSGSGPAYVYTFIEALADGGVRNGLPRATAILLAAQTVAGAAEMVLQSGSHPAVLRDNVTTPGGTTIAGLASLEHDGFRSALIESVTAATKRSEELGKG